MLHERAPRCPSPSPRRPAGPLWTPARWWQRRRQRQRLAPCRTRFSPWPWSALLPPHLAAWSPASALPQGVGRRMLGAGTREGPPEPACAPPTSGSSAPASEPGGWDAANQQPPGRGGWDAREEGVPAASLGYSFRRGEAVRPGNPRGRPGWEPGTPISTCVGGGVVWAGPTSAAAPCPSSLSSGRLLGCPPSHLSSPRQRFQSIAIEGSPPRAWGKGRVAVGTRMLKGCLLVSWSRGAELERKGACV